MGAVVVSLWLFLSIWWVVLWLVLTLYITDLARERGRSAVGYFLLSLLFSPIVAALLLIATPDREQQRRTERALADMREGFIALCKGLEEVRDGIGSQRAPETAAAGPAHSSGQRRVAASPPPEMGYCPQCRRLRASNVAKCVYCGNSDPVSLELPRYGA